MIAPGSCIGILGGGQLGRMMALAAANLGYKAHIFTPEADSPASFVAWKTTVAQYDDAAALTSFASGVEVITFEFENVPPESLELLVTCRQVHPSPAILKTTRNRLREKDFIRSLGVGTAEFARVDSLKTLREAVNAIGLPGILKTTEMGYDGKGQVTLRDKEEAENAWYSLKTNEAVLEGFVDFALEISVIVARGSDKKAVCYPPAHNIHTHHILDKTCVPAPISDSVNAEARSIAVKIADALELQGLLAVEMFVTKDNRILVNELAPRPHNSGHWTMDACLTSQFEQSIRAVCGLPLGATTLLCPVTMQNLIGDAVEEWKEYLQNPQAKLHLYGKTETRAGRKMGHVNIIEM